MELLNETVDIEGKTISTALLVDCDEKLALTFTDGTCCFFVVTHYGESFEIEVDNDVCDYIKRDAGVISQDEYDLIKANEREEREKNLRERELIKLAELQAKYGEGQIK